VVSSPSLENRLRFGPFELDPDGGQLRRSGAPIRLSPQPLKLLVLLASRAGDVVSRDEIRSRLWGTETFVDFEQGVNHCIRSIRSVLEQGPRSPVYIETVPRRGYRFVAPVEAAARGAGASPPDANADTQPLTPVSREPWWRALSRRAGDSLRRWRLRPLPANATVRLAILPFDDLTGDAERVSLSGGLTEEISTHLSRAGAERLHLVSACSAKALKQTPHPVSAARQKGVDFLLTGSVWSFAARARVNAHLVRVSDETQLWTESYERVLDDVLDFHTDVAREIAESARIRLEP
jgi:DNA-binding winged helix-turn-helix (wHTH) protein/TolB-like protein